MNRKMENSEQNESVINTKILFDLISAVETIPIEAAVGESRIKIPATKIDGTENFRIRHKILSIVMQMLRNRNPRLDLWTENVDTNQNHSVAKSHITDGESVYPTYYGECTRYTNTSLVEKAAPFQVAVNRAEDKAICDYLGLYSRVYSKDGKPLLYDDLSDGEEPLSKEKDEVLATEKTELENLRNLTIQISTKKWTRKGRIGDLPVKWLKKICEEEFADDDPNKAIQNPCRRYAALIERVEGRRLFEEAVQQEPRAEQTEKSSVKSEEESC